mmetsp:Transcript_58053/g.95855  ORF Transcript_58053/g.95855 Transcript_58053/m.95855 type:complete len:234 (-) Transcript_58053:446-1147(-)
MRRAGPKCGGTWRCGSDERVITRMSGTHGTMCTLPHPSASLPCYSSRAIRTMCCQISHPQCGASLRTRAALHATSVSSRARMSPYLPSPVQSTTPRIYHHLARACASNYGRCSRSELEFGVLADRRSFSVARCGLKLITAFTNLPVLFSTSALRMLRAASTFALFRVSAPLWLFTSGSSSVKSTQWRSHGTPRCVLYQRGKLAVMDTGQMWRLCLAVFRSSQRRLTRMRYSMK